MLVPVYALLLAFVPFMLGKPIADEHATPTKRDPQVGMNGNFQMNGNMNANPQLNGKQQVDNDPATHYNLLSNHDYYSPNRWRATDMFRSQATKDRNAAEYYASRHPNRVRSWSCWLFCPVYHLFGNQNAFW